MNVQWHSFELRPKDGPPIPPDYRAQIEAGRPQLRARAQQQYGVDLNQGPFGIDSRPALIGAKVAEARGKGEAYHKAVLRGYWQEAKNIEERTVLARIAAEIGLDQNEFLAALDEPEYEAQVDHDIALAQMYQLRGVPALVLENKYLIPGAVPTETLRQAVEQVQEEAAA